MAGLDTCDAHSCCPWRPHSRNRHRMGNSGKNTNLGPSSLFRKERSLGRWQDKSASHCLQGDASGGLGWSPGEGSLPFPGSPAVSPSPPWGDRLRMAVWLRWPPSSRGQHEQGSTGLELWVLSCICWHEYQDTFFSGGGGGEGPRRVDPRTCVLSSWVSTEEISTNNQSFSSSLKPCRVFCFKRYPKGQNGTNFKQTIPCKNTHNRAKGRNLNYVR